MMAMRKSLRGGSRTERELIDARRGDALKLGLALGSIPLIPHK